jgi:hypothetical protein
LVGREGFHKIHSDFDHIGFGLGKESGIINQYQGKKENGFFHWEIAGYGLD